MAVFQDYFKGARIVDKLQRELEEKSVSALPLVSKPFAEGLREEGITLRGTPAQFLGAYSARVVTDLTNDGTRNLWWRYNHPNAIADVLANKALGSERAKQLGPLKSGLILTATTAPALAMSGAYNLLNLGEMGRPKGFAQTYAAEGSEDRRKTDQPVSEAFERFFLGRTGRPLAYEEAKKDIPDLTPERYGNFLRSYYQDRGVLGIIKGTTENLQGVPEVRMLGYPVTIPSALGLAGGTAALAATSRAAKGPISSIRLGAAGLGGSLGGILAGNLINSAIAAANRPQLPTVAEYEMGTDRI
mgnify:CR=1 FL=1